MRVVLAGILAAGAVFAAPAFQAADEGISPAAADGRALNLDFETGTLADWKADGAAFEKQPVKGDVVAVRRADMRSDHLGTHWVGTYETGGDGPQGTLTSVPFKVTHPWASFYVAGGAKDTTCVELLNPVDGKVLVRIVGEESENLRPVMVDVSAHLGKEIAIRVVDRESGHWGHVNFDHFRFHAKRAALPNLRNQNPASARDRVKHNGLTPQEAARAMTLPDGFTCTLFAGEPDVSQPIAMAFDERGRLWIAENPDYPRWKPADQGGACRVVIFEDVDGDGSFDSRKVFCEGINFISGLEVGHGGAWIGAPPYLLFVPDKDGDDLPDGPPVPLLDGWDHQDTHETLNSFLWGPDGWLYGCHGVFTHSNVGKPGCAAEERHRINAGYWRYHPIKQRFEVFAEGGSNQWGIDFDDRGQAFATACVIPHLYHVIQGARYQRQAGNHFNPATYDDLKTIADHRHYVGSRGPHAANGFSDEAGGGHAHCGAMIYLGGHWPESYRNRIFFNNIHGARVNMDILEAKGSGFVGRHGPDLLLANDAWSQILNLRYGPDGSAFVIDWYDKQQCHGMNPGDHDRSNGRIFKVSYTAPPRGKVDLRALPSKDLVELLFHRNDWHVRHARKVLMERGSDAAVHARADVIAATHADATRVLRAMWLLHVTGGFTEARALRALGHADPQVRGWAIQLALEDREPASAVVARMLELAQKDPSPVVRLYVAAGAQRLTLEARRPIVEALVRHEEDAADPNLPLMYWYAAEPIAGGNVTSAATLLAACRIPRVREFVSRRLASK